MAADPRAIALVTLAFALREGPRTECQAELGRVHSLATPVARPKRLFEFPMRGRDTAGDGAIHVARNAARIGGIPRAAMDHRPAAIGGDVPRK